MGSIIPGSLAEGLIKCDDKRTNATYGIRSVTLSITHILMAYHPDPTISCVAGIVRDSLSGTESRERGAGHGGSVV